MDSFNDFTSFGYQENDLDQLSFTQSMNAFTPDFGFFGDATGSLGLKETDEFDEALASGISAVSTHSDDEHDEDLNVSTPSFESAEVAPKRTFANAFDEAAERSPKCRRVERAGQETYSVDGQDVPRLQLGESGRAQLKSSISSVLKRRPELRKQCNSIQKVKNASIIQLLAMARICGIWDQAVKISESFLKKYPCKKAADMKGRFDSTSSNTLTSIL
jgi:hypothetical protein